MAQPCPSKAASVTTLVLVHPQVDLDVVAAQRVVILKGNIMRVEAAAIQGFL